MLYLIPSILAGYLTKLCDKYSESKFRSFMYSLFFSFLYSFAIIFSAILKPSILPLIAGVVAGNIFAGKVDTREHLFASFLILTFYLLNFQAGFFWIFITFTFVAFIDEFLHEWGTKIKNKYIKSRFISPFIAFIISIYLNDFSYVLFMVLFDIGYKIGDK